MAAWRRRQFEYTWLRTAGGQYKDFWSCTEDGLRFAADELELNLHGSQRRRLMAAYLDLKPWPDVLPGLRRLKRSGYQLALLSNFTPNMLQTSVDKARASALFDALLSTDAVRTFKPDPAAYRLGETSLSLHRDEVLFVAFAGWDAAGAKWFGYPTFWLNRTHAPAEHLDAPIDGTGSTFAELVNYISS